MDMVVVVDVIKRQATPWRRLGSDSHVMSTGSVRPLEDAFRIAQTDLVSVLVSDYRLAKMDAYQLVSRTVESPLANVCDTNFTSLAKGRKAWLLLRKDHSLKCTSALWAVACDYLALR